MVSDDMKNIHLFLYLPDHFNFKMYSQLIIEIMKCLRHEFDHIDNFKKGKLTSWDEAQSPDAPTANINTYKKYLLDPSEMTAYVSEAYYEAKKSHLPFDFVLKRLMTDMKNYMSGYPNAEKKDIEIVVSEVYNKYMDYAKTKYPNMVLSNY
jgi:hypothetical protein